MARPHKYKTLKIDPKNKDPNASNAEVVEKSVEDLAFIGCTNEEISAFLGLDSEVVAARFAEKIRKGKMRGYVSLRRQAFHRAITDKSDKVLIKLLDQLPEMSRKLEMNLTISTKEEAVAKSLLERFKGLLSAG